MPVLARWRLVERFARRSRARRSVESELRALGRVRAQPLQRSERSGSGHIEVVPITDFLYLGIYYLIHQSVVIDAALSCSHHTPSNAHSSLHRPPTFRHIFYTPPARTPKGCSWSRVSVILTSKRPFDQQLLQQPLWSILFFQPSLCCRIFDRTGDWADSFSTSGKSALAS